MNETRDVAQRESTDTKIRTGEQTRETVLLPPVDICEDAEGITLTADMPGVSKNELAIRVDRDSLLIEGEAKLDMPEGMEALYADVRSTRYRRDFTLSSELDVDSVDANLKDGVLTLRIPKRAELRPRKIEVRSE